MQSLTLLGLLLVFTAGAEAQRGGFRGAPAHRPAPGVYGHGNILNPGGVTSTGGTFGYGNILFPGGVTAFPNGITMPSPPRPALGTLWDPYANTRGGVWRGAHRNRTVVVPFAMPVWTGPAYDPGYMAPQAGSNVTVVVPQQPSPSVIINHNYTPETARPVMRDYSNTELPQTEVEQGGIRVYDAPTPGKPEEQRAAAPGKSSPAVAAPASDKPTIYLIALKDASVRAAIGYWIEGAQLKYVTPQAQIQQFGLEMLDEETTRQLNKQQGLEWDLSR